MTGALSRATDTTASRLIAEACGVSMADVEAHYAGVQAQLAKMRPKPSNRPRFEALILLHGSATRNASNPVSEPTADELSQKRSIKGQERQ